VGRPRKQSNGRGRPRSAAAQALCLDSALNEEDETAEWSVFVDGIVNTKDKYLETLIPRFKLFGRRANQDSPTSRPSESIDRLLSSHPANNR